MSKVRASGPVPDNHSCGFESHRVLEATIQIILRRAETAAGDVFVYELCVVLAGGYGIGDSVSNGLWAEARVRVFDDDEVSGGCDLIVVALSLMQEELRLRLGRSGFSLSGI